MLRRVLSWRPDRIALAYSGTALGYSLMHPVFNFYYVKVFLDIYKINVGWFHTVQTLYMIWNALNDPLFGYCQDHSKWSIVRSRRHTILYGAPLFALSFLVPWFSWGNYEENQWLCAAHLLVALFFYDAMFTYVLLASGCLCAEMTSSHEQRIKMTQYGAVVILIGSTGVFFCEQISNHLINFHSFQITCIVLAVLAFLSMSYTGKNAVTLYDLKNRGDDKKISDRSTNESIFRLTWQILSNPNFFWFVMTNFMTDFHGTFSSNFCVIIVETLIPKSTLPVIAWSIFYGAIMFLPKLFFIIVRPLMSTIGYYKISRTMMILKFVFGLSIFFIGREKPEALLLFLMCDSILAHSMGSMFGLISSDIIDDDMERYQRNHPMSSMVMGTNALVTKPAQSLAPMVTVAILNAYGYNEYKKRQLSSMDQLEDCMFYMVALLPVFVGIFQFLCWSRYGLRDSYLKKNKKGSEEIDVELEMEALL